MRYPRCPGNGSASAGVVLPRGAVGVVRRGEAGRVRAASPRGHGSSRTSEADRAGDGDYARAVRLFVAEEQNHARLLARLLAAGGVPPLTGRWSDTVFVRLRRLMGLRRELLVLMIAEVVALRCHRALREGADDPLTSDVAGRILADEQRHVPFPCERLHALPAELPHATRRPVTALWRLPLLAVCLVVAVDHGPALRRLAVGRLRFVADVMASSGAVGSAVRVPRPDAWTSAARPWTAGCFGVEWRRTDRGAAGPLAVIRVPSSRGSAPGPACADGRSPAACPRCRTEFDTSFSDRKYGHVCVPSISLRKKALPRRTADGPSASPTEPCYATVMARFS